MIYARSSRQAIYIVRAIIKDRERIWTRKGPFEVLEPIFLVMLAMAMKIGLAGPVKLTALPSMIPYEHSEIMKSSKELIASGK